MEALATIDDDEVREVPKARIFETTKHCFNPLKNMEYKRARETADVLYAISPQGEKTLTARNGKRALKGISPVKASRPTAIRWDE